MQGRSTTAPRSRRTAVSGRGWLARRPLRILTVVVILAGLLAPLTLISPAQSAHSARELDEIALMPHAVTNVVPFAPAALVVDEQRSLGFAIGQELEAGPNNTKDTRLVVHDLSDTSGRVLAQYPEQDPPEVPEFPLNSSDTFRIAIDEREGRLIAPSSLGFEQLCNPNVGSDIITYEYGTGPLPTKFTEERLKIPCSGPYEFAPISASIYEVEQQGGLVRKLLLAGTYQHEAWRLTLPIGLQNNAGQPLIVRQIDLDRLYASTETADPEALDWEIDLRFSGCGRWDSKQVFLERIGDDLLSYCWDTRPILQSLGAQGYVVKIPLGDDHAPTALKGLPVIPDPTNPSAAVPPVPDPTDLLPEDVVPDAPPGVNLSQVIQACLNAPPQDPSVTVLGQNISPVACADAAAQELLRQGSENVDHILDETPNPDPDPGDPLVPGLPNPSDPGSIDEANPTGSKFIANPEVFRTPALPGPVVPFADAVAGRVLLLTANEVNGNAVWVFDPEADRFIGLVTGGAIDQPLLKTAGGFDVERGRAYLLTAGGILSAAVRQSPLPGGKVSKIVNDPEDQTVFRTMAVAPKLQRLFIPLSFGGEALGYAVVDDHMPDPPTPSTFDPDTLTKQIDEVEGETVADRSGAAQASGMHVVVAGGVPRIINQLDPFCEAPTNLDTDFEREAFGGRCLADLFVSRGSREAFVAASTVEASSSTGAVAESSGLFFPPTERPTDEDVRNLGSCLQNTAQAFDERFDYSALCDPIQDVLASVLGDDVRDGTSGTDDPDTEDDEARGFPIPRTECADFGGAPTSEDSPTGVKKQVSSSFVSCDADAVTATAHANAAPVNLPSANDPVVTVGDMSSFVETIPTAAGRVTLATASVEGVTVGGLAIGSIRTLAVSQARGRSGTAGVSFVRLWCQITQDGSPFATGCRNPEDPDIQQLLSDINQGLGRVHLSVPDVSDDATPGGYQAVVTKHPDARAADRAVNDDDTHTVAGLQIVLFNDGAEGRSRVVTQLAGVHTEARYGIVELPDFNIPDFPDVEPPAIITNPFVPPTVAGTQARTIEDPVRIITIGSRPRPPDNPLAQFFNAPAQTFRNFLSWLINNPLEAALLFMLLSILASPIYLTLRARAAARALELSET